MNSTSCHARPAKLSLSLDAYPAQPTKLKATEFRVLRVGVDVERQWNRGGLNPKGIATIPK